MKNRRNIILLIYLTIFLFAVFFRVYNLFCYTSKCSFDKFQEAYPILKNLFLFSSFIAIGVVVILLSERVDKLKMFKFPKKIKNPELKLFLTFFIIYFFFIHWIGWNENTNLILTRAIVDGGKFEIDSHHNTTSDRAFYNNHYYSDKTPGLSLLATPIYGIWKFIYHFFPEDFIKNDVSTGKIEIPIRGTNLIDYIYLSFFLSVSMFLVTLFTSTLFTALSVIMVFKISKYFTKNEKDGLLLAVVYGLGTLALPYAIVFYNHATGTFFALLAFYLLLRAKQEKSTNKHYLLAGLAAGIGIVIGEPKIIIAVACFIYLLHFRKENSGYYILGLLIGALPLLLYNFFVFDNPFTIPRHHLDPVIWELPGLKGIRSPNPFVMLRLIAFPFKGLFFYYPILLFSLIGLYQMYKKKKPEALLISFVCFTFLILNSSWWAWHGGTCFGPRHLHPLIPFLTIPLIYSLKLIQSPNRSLKLLFLIFLLISIFVNILGMSGPHKDSLIAENRITISEHYQERTNSFQVLSNPLRDHYLPNFLKYGMRSRIFESLISKNPVDIRSQISSQISDPRFLKREVHLFHTRLFNINLKLNFLVLPLILLMISIIWLKEIRTTLEKSKTNSFAYFLIFCLLLFLMLFGVDTNFFVFSEGWYEREPDTRAMKQDGIIYFYNNRNLRSGKLIFSLSSYKRDRKITIFLNDNIIGSYLVPEEYKQFSTIVDFKPNKNIIRIHSEEECEFTETYDRCISLFLKNITLVIPPQIKEGEEFIQQLFEPVYDEGWYPVYYYDNTTFRWMKEEGTITVYNFDHSKDYIRIKLSVNNFLKENRTLQIYINSDLKESLTIAHGDNEIITRLVELKEGENKIKFKSIDGCYVPSELGLWEEDRCFSFNFKKITLLIPT